MTDGITPTCCFCAGKCRGHSLCDGEWVPEPGSQGWEPGPNEHRLLASFQVAPSNMSAWLWSLRPGATWTDMQLKAAHFLNVRIADCDSVAARIPAPREVLSIPAGSPPQFFVHPCPIIGREGNRVRVISPAGVEKLIYPNGTITKPRARKWRRRS